MCTETHKIDPINGQKLLNGKCVLDAHEVDQMYKSMFALETVLTFVLDRISQEITDALRDDWNCIFN